MKKQITFLRTGLLVAVMLWGVMGGAKAQTNLIGNPGFEDNTNTVTDVAYSPSTYLLRRVASTAITVTSSTLPAPTTPEASTTTVADGVWYKKQSVTTGAATSYYQASDSHSGTNCLMLRNLAGTTTTGIIWSSFNFQQRLSLSNTKKYTLTFWAKKILTISTVKVFIGDKSGNTGGAVFSVDVSLTGGTTWTKYTVNYDVPYIITQNSALDYTTAYVGIGYDAVYSGSPSKTVTGQVLFDDFSLAESTTPVISSTSSSTTNLKPFPITITFNNSVTDFISSDISVTNGTVSGFSGSGTTYTANVTPTNEGVVNINIAAAAATDGLSNATLAATQFSRTFTITAPDAPTAAVATAGNGKASVSFSAPANNGGSAITSYTVTSNSGSFTGTGSTSPITVTGLSNGTAYTFAVTATNLRGTSAASTSSASVTPHAINNNIAVSAATNISALSLTPVSDLVVAKDALLTVNQPTTISSITISAGGQVTNSNTLNATSLTLNSNATDGTATYVNNGTSNITTLNANQYLGTTRNWYVSSPVVSTASSTSNIAAYYEYIEAGNNSGFASQAVNSTLFWKGYTPGATFMEAGKGYIALPSASSAAISFSGAMNTGDVTVSLSKTNAGYNLIGNPYPCHLTWTQAFATANTSKIYPTIWVRTNSGSSNSDGWSFNTHNALVGETVPSWSDVEIAPMQAFWVKAKAVGTLTLNNTLVRSHNNTNRLKAPAAKNTDRQRVRLQVSNGTKTDEALIYFDAAASNTFDDFDSPKYAEPSSVMQIFSKINNEKLVINGMNAIVLDTPIPVGFIAGNATAFSLKANEISNIPSGFRVVLKDNANQAETDLTDGTATYNFSPATTVAERFSIIFRSPSSPTGFENINKPSVQVFVNAVNQITIIAPEKSNYAIYNAMGQLMENGKLNAELQTVKCKLQTGIYVVKVGNQSNRVIIK